MTLIKNYRLTYAAMIFAVVLGANSLFGASVSANTVVGAVVCSPSNSASLAISQPVDGHTTADMPVTISGSLNLLSQIRVFVDNVFTETVPIASDASTFSFELTLPTGSHEVRLEGVDICQLTSPVAQVVVIYNPETTVVGQPSAPQGPQTPAPEYETIEDQSTFLERITQNGVISGISSAAYSALEALDIVNSNEQDQTTRMVSRFALVTVGSTLVLFAPWVLNSVAGVAARLLPQQAALAIGRLRALGPLWVRVAGFALLAFGLM